MEHDDTSTTRRAMLRAVGGTAATAATGGLAAAAPDELVRANVGYSAASGRRAALDAADEVIYDFAFDALTLRLPREAMAGLAARPDVRYVEEDGTMDLHSQTESWGYTRIDADEVNADGHTGSGIHVAILDSGIDAEHEDLVPNLGTGKAVENCSVFCDEPWDDDVGHGTWVAGILGAVDDTDGVVGVAPDATLHAVKVCDREDGCFDSSIADGLQWTADQGHDVASMSFGREYSDCVADAVDYADSKGVIMVASVGQEDGGCSSGVKYPASDSNVVAVSATDDNDDFLTSACRGHEVEFAAPGVNVATTDLDGGTTEFTGVSAAVPHVSGAIAVLMSGYYSGPEAVDRLHVAAEDVGLDSHEQGSGLVNLGDTFEPAVATDAAFPGTSITTLRGDLVDLAQMDSAECYFEYKLTSSSIYSDSASVTRSSTGLYDVDIATTTDTAYDFRAVAEFPDGSVRRGDVLTFRTPEDDDGGTTE